MIETEVYTGILPLKAEDIIWLIEHGVKEFGLKIIGTQQIREVAEAREANNQCLTAIVNDEIVGCGGIDLLWPGVGEVWLMLSCEIDKYPLQALQIIKDGLAKLIDDNNLWRAEAWGRVGFPQAHKLFKYLGFKVEGKGRKRTPDKADAILYAIVRD